MRDSITVLAILLIVALTAALVGPYFIDWNNHRGFIESRLSQAAGAPVTVAGPIEVRLLPQPTFRLSQVSLGEAQPGQPSLTAQRLDAQVSLTALMRGDIEVTEATLQQPRLALPAGGSGGSPLRLPAIADPQRIQIQHVVIVDGSVALADPDGRVTTVSGLDLEGEATSLIGPLKFTGQFGTGTDRHGFRLSTGAYEGGRLRLKLTLDGSGALPNLDLDGSVVAGSGSAGPHFDGALLLTGAIPVPYTPATVPWRITATVQADRDRVGVADLEMRAGTDLRAGVATGSGDLAVGDRPELRLKIHAAQVNLDALAVAPGGSQAVPPRGLDLLARLDRAGAAPGALPTLPVRLDLDYVVDSASAGSQSIFGIAGRLRLDGDAPADLQFRASGPDGARLALDGRLEGGTAPVFRGRLETAVRDLAGFGAWLAPARPDAAEWLKRVVPARSASFSGTVDLSPVGGAARDATVTLDRTSLAGTLSYTQAVGSDRARLFADLKAGDVTLDDLPVLDGPNLDWADLDLDLNLAAASVTLAPRLDPSGFSGALGTGQIAVRLRKTGAEATLDRLSADFGTARLRASGSLDAHAAKLQAMVDAPDLAPIAGLLAHLAPGRGAALAQARAPVLSPARLSLSIDATRGRDGGLLPEAVSIVGRANGTDVDAQLKPDRPGDLDPATAAVTAHLSARSPQSVTLLRQLGLPLKAGDPDPATAEPAQVEADAHGSFTAGFDTTLDAALAGGNLAFRGRVKPDLGSGHVRLAGKDLLPALKATGLMAASAQGPVPLQGEADLSWHDSNVALRHLGGLIAGTSFSGDLNTDLAPPPPTRSQRPVLFGTLSLDRLDLDALFGLALGPPDRTGESGGALAWSDQPFGPAPLSLPRTEIAVKAAHLGFEPNLVGRAASFTLRQEGGAVTVADLTTQLSGGGLGGTLALRRDGPTASLSGTLSLSDIAVALPGFAAKLGGSIDLAGSGTSPSTLVASLAGRGSVIVAEAALSGADPSAIPRTAHLAEQNTSEVDADAVRALLTAELARGPLPIGSVAGPASLAAGTLRLGPLQTEGDGWTSDTEGTVDLRTLSGSLRTTIEERQPLPDWKGDAARVGIVLHDLPARSDPEVDAIGFVNALQSRAIARDQERIDIIQQDIRERAAFNRRLKAIEADQKAVRDQAKAEAEARSAADLDRLLGQDKLVPFDLAPQRTPVGPAVAGPAPAKATRPPSTGSSRSVASPPPPPTRPRNLQPRLAPATPGAPTTSQRIPGPADPALEGRY